MADIPPRESSPPPPIKRFGEWIIRELVPAGEKFLHFLRSQNEGPGQLLEPKPIEVKSEMKEFFECNLPQIKQSSVDIGDQIAVGGQSSVHHAKSPDYGDVAFKVFHSKSEDQKYHKRELKYAVLRHPNIVQSLAVVLNENNMPSGFLMELMPHSLANVISLTLSNAEEKKEKETIQYKFKYSTPEVLDWMLKVCTALLFLHNLKIMHRDVKPANIMVEVDKSGFISKVKLTDLGVAGSIYQNPDITHTQWVSLVRFYFKQKRCLMGITMKKSMSTVLDLLFGSSFIENTKKLNFLHLRAQNLILTLLSIVRLKSRILLMNVVV